MNLIDQYYVSFINDTFDECLKYCTEYESNVDYLIFRNVIKKVMRSNAADFLKNDLKFVARYSTGTKRLLLKFFLGVQIYLLKEMRRIHETPSLHFLIDAIIAIDWWTNAQLKHLV